MRLPIWIIVGMVAVLLSVPAAAIDYTIDFDVLSNHPNAPEGAVVQPGAFTSWWPWRSVGFQDQHGNLTGADFRNGSGLEIKAIHIKLNHPRTAQNPTGDTITATASSGHDLFDTVWLKNDRSEVIFMDGSIPNRRHFWNQLPASTPTEIQECRANPNVMTCPFVGRCFTSNPPDPDGMLWTRLSRRPTGLTKSWAAFRDSVPSQYRNVDCYGESPDGRYVVFLSRGRLLMFDGVEGKSTYLDEGTTEEPGVNRIAFEGGAFVLYRTGVKGTAYRPGEWRLTTLDE